MRRIGGARAQERAHVKPHLVQAVLVRHRPEEGVRRARAARRDAEGLRQGAALADAVCRREREVRDAQEPARRLERVRRPRLPREVRVRQRLAEQGAAVPPSAQQLVLLGRGAHREGERLAADVHDERRRVVQQAQRGGPLVHVLRELSRAVCLRPRPVPVQVVTQVAPKEAQVQRVFLRRRGARVKGARQVHPFLRDARAHVQRAAHELEGGARQVRPEQHVRVRRVMRDAVEHGGRERVARPAALGAGAGTGGAHLRARVPLVLPAVRRAQPAPRAHAERDVLVRVRPRVIRAYDRVAEVQVLPRGRGDEHAHVTLRAAHVQPAGDGAGKDAHGGQG
mmetsp:Transcript_12790/g.37535  ORF Transcript_12790/g.37535 Transcript_12790/m.37535 type:complete len:339 (-) Transcript_12790:984-2000(-)